ncbi:MAG: HNH endonuclease [Pseudomonadota bacterium]
MSYATRTLLDKAARDNGFHDAESEQAGWLCYRSPLLPVGICMTAWEDRSFSIGTDHRRVWDELDAHWPEGGPCPAGFRAWQVPDSESLYRLAGRIWKLANALPQQPLHEFQKTLSQAAVDTTEVERLHKQRIGQDIFRSALLDYWGEACAVTALAVSGLLKASHIIPWAKCEQDAERLNVMNGLLLSAQLDAAFDSGLISFDEEGRIVFSDHFPEDQRQRAQLHPGMRLRWVTGEHRQRLEWHRENVFQG